MPGLQAQPRGQASHGGPAEFSVFFCSGGFAPARQPRSSANPTILPGQPDPCCRRFRPGSEDDLPSKSTLSSEACGSSSSGSLPSLNDDEPDMCSAESVAWALQLKCPCECLADNDLRLREQSLREMAQLMSQESRKQFVWFELQKLAPSRPPVGGTPC